MKPERVGVVHQSPSMQAVVSHIKEIAATERPVLLFGEEGTGKSRLARLLVSESRRAEGCLVEVAYAPEPSETARDEIFGAEEEHPGALQGAAGGTMLIDELRSLPLPAQDELLSFLKTGKVRGQPVDVRVILLCHLPGPDSLADLVAKGLLRERFLEEGEFSVVKVPPLRERREEIPSLCRDILAEEANVWTLPEGGGKPSLSEEALSLFMRYHWPKNTSELKRELIRAVGRSGGGEIKPEHLSEKLVSLRN